MSSSAVDLIIEIHPPWCSGGPVPCGDHVSAPTVVPATAGAWRESDHGLMVPKVEVSARLSASGQPSVDLSAYDPTGTEDRWLTVALTPAEAQRISTALTSGANLAEGRTAVTA